MPTATLPTFDELINSEEFGALSPDHKKYAVTQWAQQGLLASHAAHPAASQDELDQAVAETSYFVQLNHAVIDNQIRGDDAAALMERYRETGYAESMEAEELGAFRNAGRAAKKTLYGMSKGSIYHSLIRQDPQAAQAYEMELELRDPTRAGFSEFAGSVAGSILPTAAALAATILPEGYSTAAGIAVLSGFGASAAGEGVKKVELAALREGRVADLDDKILVGTGYAVAEIAAEKFQLDFLKGLARPAAKAVGEAALTSRQVFVKEFSKAIAASTGENAVEEVITQVAQNMADVVFADLDTPIFEGVGLAAGGGALGGGILGGPVAAARGAAAVKLNGLKALEEAGPKLNPGTVEAVERVRRDLIAATTDEAEKARLADPAQFNVIDVEALLHDDTTPAQLKADLLALRDMQKLGERLGIEVVAVAGMGQNGLILPDDPGRVFVDIRESVQDYRGIQGIAGHEMYHALKRSSEVGQTLAARIEALVDTGGEAFADYAARLAAIRSDRGLSKIRRAELVEEVAADFVATQMFRAEFWDRVAKRDRTLFEQMYDTFNRFVERLKGLVFGMSQAEEIISDLVAARDYAADLFTGKQSDALSTDVVTPPNVDQLQVTTSQPITGEPTPGATPQSTLAAQERQETLTRLRTAVEARRERRNLDTLGRRRVEAFEQRPAATAQRRSEVTERQPRPEPIKSFDQLDISDILGGTTPQLRAQVTEQLANIPEDVLAGELDAAIAAILPTNLERAGTIRRLRERVELFRQRKVLEEQGRQRVADFERRAAVAAQPRDTTSVANRETGVRAPQRLKSLADLPDDLAPPERQFDETGQGLLFSVSDVAHLFDPPSEFTTEDADALGRAYRGDTADLRTMSTSLEDDANAALQTALDAPDEQAFHDGIQRAGELSTRAQLFREAAETAEREALDASEPLYSVSETIPDDPAKVTRAAGRANRKATAKVYAVPVEVRTMHGLLETKTMTVAASTVAQAKERALNAAATWAKKKNRTVVRQRGRISFVSQFDVVNVNAGQPLKVEGWGKSVSGTGKNMAPTYENIDRAMALAQTMPGLGLTEDEWARVLAVGMHGAKATLLPGSPKRLSQWLQDPQSFRDFVTTQANKDQGVIDAAVEGLAAVRQAHQIAQAGQLTEQRVAHHFLWGLLSRMLDPLNQEAGWIKLVNNPAVNRMIQASIDGTYTGTKEQWTKIVRQSILDVQPELAVGRAATQNANAFHAMLEQYNGRWAELRDLVQDPNLTGQDIRREYVLRGFSGAGIRNKVLDFVLATLSRPDVFVGDRWQVVNLWYPDVERAAAIRAEKGGDPAAIVYDQYGVPQDTTKAYSTISGLLNGTGSEELIYTLVEHGLRNVIAQNQEFLQGIFGYVPDVFDIHWLTWNIIKEEAVGHSSLESTYEAEVNQLYRQPDWAERFAETPKQASGDVAGQRVTFASPGGQRFEQRVGADAGGDQGGSLLNSLSARVEQAGGLHRTHIGVRFRNGAVAINDVRDAETARHQTTFFNERFLPDGSERFTVYDGGIVATLANPDPETQFAIEDAVVRQRIHRDPIVTTEQALRRVGSPLNSLTDPNRDLDELGEFIAKHLRQQAAGVATGLAGTPQRANPVQDASVRGLVDIVDSVREARGLPERQAIVEIRQRAQNRVNAAPQEEWAKLLNTGNEKAVGGTTLDFQSAEDVMVARLLMDRFGADAIARGDTAAIARVGLAVDIYRSERAELARALMIGRDFTETPAQRHRRFITLALTQPSPEVMRRIQNLGYEDRIKELQKEAAKRMRVVQQLKALGYDINSLTDAQLSDPVIVANILRQLQTITATAGDKVFEYWRNSILSSPTTQLANIIGNSSNLVWEYTAQRGAEAMVNLLSGNRLDATTFAELKEAWKGFLPGIIKGWRNGLLSWDTESPTMDQSGKLELRGVAIGGTKGRVLRTPQRLLLAADEIAKSLVVQMEVRAQAYRNWVAAGKTGSLSAYMNAAEADQSSAEWTAALEQARFLTFQTEPGALAHALIQWRDSKSTFVRWGARFLFPFIVTPANIVKQGVAATPLGLAKLVADAKAGKPTSTQVRNSARFLLSIGTTLAIAAMMEPDEDDEDGRPWITGSPAGFRDRGQREFQYRYAPPQSIRLGDRWFSYARIEPFATTLTGIVDILHTAKSAENLEEVLGGTAAAASQPFTEKTFLRGIGDLWRVIEDTKDGNTDQAQSWVANFAASWHWNLFRAGTRAAQPTIDERRALSTGERIVEGLAPGTLAPPKVDLWGRDVKNEGVFGGPLTDYVYKLTMPIRTQSEQPVELDRLIFNYNRADVEGRKPWYPQQPSHKWTVTRHGKDIDVELTADEYHDFLVARGEAALRLLAGAELNYDEPTERDKGRIDNALSNATSIAKAEINRRRREAGVTASSPQ